MKFIVDTFKEFGLMLTCGLFLFGTGLFIVLSIMLPFLVPLYVDSLFKDHLAIHWIFTLVFATIFVEFAIARAIEGDY